MFNSILKGFKFFIIIIFLLIICGCSNTTQDNSNLPNFENFITRKKDKLYDGNKEFHFISVNVPNFHIVEDRASLNSSAWHRITEFEQRDIVKTVALMGGQVFRIYTFSIIGGKHNKNHPDLSHILGIDPKTDKPFFNEELFKDLDRGLVIAREYGIRIIIPFVDNWEWFGGDKQWADLRSKEDFEFYYNKKCIKDFKYFISWLLNRKNTITGQLYKDDKTIMCWELGNELAGAPDEWINEITSYIKKIDHNHLIMDGMHQSFDLSPNSLKNPDIDILTLHYMDTLKLFRDQSKDKKPFVLGEFNATSSTITTLLDEIIDLELCGALIWSLRFHSDTGGFYYHRDFPGNDSLHYPGFPDGEPFEENKLLSIIREKAYEIQGLKTPPHPVPDSPILLPIENPKSISWKGSAGAINYDLERSLSAEGPWKIIGKDIVDTLKEDNKEIPKLPLFKDDTAIPDKTYYYRIKAKNMSGASEYSNIVKLKL